MEITYKPFVNNVKKNSKLKQRAPKSKKKLSFGKIIFVWDPLLFEFSGPKPDEADIYDRGRLQLRQSQNWKEPLPKLLGGRP